MIDNPLVSVVGVPALSKLLKLCCQVTFPLESSLATNTLANVLCGVKLPATTYPPSEACCTSLSNTSSFASVVVPTATRPPSPACLILVIELPPTPALYTLAHSTLPVELTFSTSAHWIPPSSGQSLPEPQPTVPPPSTYPPSDVCTTDTPIE